MEYWELILPKIKDLELSQKESIRRLNKSRVALKHHGNLPSKLDIEAFRASSAIFFIDNTKIIFDLDFDTISLVELIHHTEAKNRLKLATSQIKSGNVNDAIDNIAISFDQVINDYINRSKLDHHDSPFQFGEKMTFWGLKKHRFGSTNKSFENEIIKLSEDIKKTFSSIQDTLKIVTLGIEYKKYSKFKYFMPHLNKLANGEYRVVRNSWYPKVEANETEALECIDFVVETSLLLDSFKINY